METVQLITEKRTQKKPRDIRASGYIPAVIYGPALGGATRSVSLEYQAFRKAFRVAGESTVIELEVEGKTFPVLVHSVEYHPVSGEFEHVDFYAIDMKKVVHAHIMLKFVGTAKVVKEKNAILNTTKDQLSVECLPRNLVHDIEVDISGMSDYHDHICVKDVQLPAGIKVLDDPEAILISAVPPKVSDTGGENEVVTPETEKKE